MGPAPKSFFREAHELIELANASLEGDLTPIDVAGQRRDIVKLVREQASQWSEAAIATLAGVMLYSDDQALKMQAADKLLDRSVGRPSQSVELEAGGSLLEWMADPTAATDDDDIVESVPMQLPPPE